MSTPDLAKLEATAKEIRRKIIKITTEAGSGHPSSSMSATEVVTALYFGGFLRHNKSNPRDPKRDRFILSKGHAVPVLYSALCEAGYFTFDQIMTLRKLGSPFEGHPNMAKLDCIEASTGSLGQGLSLGVGHALACRLDGYDAHTYVMSGDGEMGEGQMWEAIASASKYKLSNLTLIIDQNGYQQTGSHAEVLDLRPFDSKLKAFGWETLVINGNVMSEVVDALGKLKSIKDRPTCIVSQTKKGFGILPVLETTGDVNYHGKPLSKELAEKALAYLA
ncbi:MAG: transketolase [Planctomycetaceae bacterium]|nr:transketolase [Planctomycetaceae bacterium]